MRKRRMVMMMIRCLRSWWMGRPFLAWLSLALRPCCPEPATTTALPGRTAGVGIRIATIGHSRWLGNPIRVGKQQQWQQQWQQRQQ